MQLRYLCFFLGLTLWGCRDHDSSAGQKQGHIKEDSVTFYLDRAAQSPSPFRELNRLRQQFEHIEEPDTTDLYHLSRLAIAYNVYGRPETYLKISRSILKQSAEKGWQRRAAKACYFISEYHRSKEATDSALFYILKSIQWAESIKDVNFKSELYINKGRIELDIGDYYNGEQSGMKAWELVKNTSKNENHYFALNLIAIAANELKSYDFSIEFHQRALDIARQLPPNAECMVETSLNNIGVVYQNKAEYPSAISYFKQALQNKDLKVQSPILYGMVLDNLAYAEFKLRPSVDQIRLLQQALEFKKKNKFIYSEVLTRIHLSECYWYLQQNEKAQNEATRAYKESVQGHFLDGRLLSFKQLSQVFPKQSVAYMNAYLKLQDSINEAERIRKNQFAHIKFKTDEIIEEKNALEVRNRIVLLMSILVLSLAVALYIIRVQKARTKELLLKQQQQLANEEIYQLLMHQQHVIDETRQQEKKRIARDIHDSILGQMFGTRLYLESLNEANDEQSIQKRYHFLEQMQKIESELRQISHTMASDVAHRFDNFVSLVHHWAEEQQGITSAHIHVDFEMNMPWKKINSNIKINLFRMVQESVQNCHKYAQANNITLTFAYQNNNIIYTITDDGTGFDLQKKRKGIGLQNIESRVTDLGGQMQIESAPNQGTKIIVTLPVTQTAPQADEPS